MCTDYSFFLTVLPGISKKMLKASKYARCEVLAYWAQPASNHLYWCAANCEEDGKLLVEMWKSESIICQYLVLLYTEVPR